MLKLSRVNNFLLTAIIILCLYVIIAPFAPNIFFAFENRGGTKAKQLTTEIHNSTSPAKTTPKEQGNRVIIPSMLLDQPVLEGPVAQTYAILNKGIWRWPDGSTPDKGGNTVLIGHRFTYTNPRGVFYFLNKVKINDEIGIFWNSKKYVYKVSTIKVVAPSDTNILGATKQSEVTLYTCTPLWLPKNRLVVTAKLETN